MSFPLTYLESAPRPVAGLTYVSPYEPLPAPRARMDQAPPTQLATQQEGGYTVPRFGVEANANISLLRAWGDDVKPQVALTGSYVVPASNFGVHSASRDTTQDRPLPGAEWVSAQDPPRRDPDERMPGAEARVDRLRVETPLMWSRIEANTPPGPMAAPARTVHDRLLQPEQVLALK